MAEKTIRQLRQEYEALCAKCSAFDPETKSLLRELEERRAKWLAERKDARAKLLALKGQAYQAWQAAEAAAKAPVPAPAPAAKK